MRALPIALALLSIAFPNAPLVRAQTLPFRRYDVPEGLPNSRVNFVFQDSRGYLWFGTWEGLSRFDGLEFTNYSTAEGLPNFLVNAIAEDSRGRIWVATQGGGVARLLDRDERPSSGGGSESGSRFEIHSVGSSRESNIVVGLFFDRDGTLWCGCEAGIFRAAPDGSSAISFEPVLEPVLQNASADSAQFGCTDARGRVWVSTRNGILELDGSAHRGSDLGAPRILARPKPPEPQSGLTGPIAVLPNPSGGILAAYARDLFELELSDQPETPPVWRRLPIALSPFQEIRCALFASRNTLWIGTTIGLIRWRDGVQTTYTTDNGLPDISIRSLREDRDHVLWMGTWSSGAVKLASEAFLNFVLPEAMPDRNALHVFEARDGAIYAPGRAGVVRVTDHHAELVPGSLDPEFAEIGARILQDRRGDFWIGTQRGLYRFAGPTLELRGGRHFTAKDGIGEVTIFGAIHEDPSGRIWTGALDGYLYSWEPVKNGAPRFERIALQDEHSMQVPRQFLSDSAGQLWLAPYVGLARIVGGHLERLEACEGLRDLQTRFLFQDRRGRVWVATRFRGVSVTDEPAAERPRFRNYSTGTGLASDAVWSIAEDEQERMYFGTSRGLERLDVESGRVQHITSLDGLAGNIVNHVIADRRGNIWAATSGGLSRYDPRAESPTPGPPPIYLSRVRIAGDDLQLSETGEVAIPRRTLPPSQDNLLIEFVGLSFRGERAVAYQYELEGVDGDWSPPSPQRSVNYAHLAPGDYRFLVRAVLPSGVTSSIPASFEFQILPPLWRRGWFLLGCALALGVLVYALHRARVHRLLVLEGLRTQIATDIHDDMGSGLSQIAILTEVAKREAPASAQGYLDEVAKLARSMRDSMSDIVWAVDPRRDRFGDLVSRMRQVSFNLLEAEGLSVRFRAPADAEIEHLGLAPDKRRHLLLILKESLSNVARHARASQVEIDIRLEPAALRLTIRDDGVGFDTGAETRGHGLASLHRRATALSSRIEITSRPGAGTALEITVPL